MKKIISTIITMLMILSMVSIATATNETTTEEATDAGTTPDSIWYGLDRAMERISLALTFNKAKQAQKRLKIAEERISELQEMTKQKKHKYMNELIKNRDKNVLEAVEIIEAEEKEGKNMSQVRTRLEEQYQRHAEVFIKVLDQVGSDKAREMIQANMNKSQEKFQERLQTKLQNKTQNKTGKDVIKAIQSGNKNVTKTNVTKSKKLDNQTKIPSLLQKGKGE